MAGAAVVRRGLAPQPPRLPDLGVSWAAVVGDRYRRLADPRPRAPRARLERSAHLARAPGREACRVGVRGAGQDRRLELRMTGKVAGRYAERSSAGLSDRSAHDRSGDP